MGHCDNHLSYIQQRLAALERYYQAHPHLFNREMFNIGVGITFYQRMLISQQTQLDNPVAFETSQTRADAELADILDKLNVAEARIR